MNISRELLQFYIYKKIIKKKQADKILEDCERLKVKVRDYMLAKEYVTDVRELSVFVDGMSDRLDRALIRRAERARDKFDSLVRSRAIADFGAVITALSDKVSSLYKDAQVSYESGLADKRLAFLTSVGKLEVLNPLSVMTRGYSVAQKNGKAVSNITEIEVGDSITVRVIGGSISATVESKTTD